MARASAGEAAVAPAASAVTRTASGTAGVGTAGAVGMFTVASDRPGATVAVGTAVDDASACQVWHTVAGNLREARSCCQWLPAKASPRLHEVRFVAVVLCGTWLTETADLEPQLESGLLPRSAGLFLALWLGPVFLPWAILTWAAALAHRSARKASTSALVTLWSV
jgi:hypothetical protein